MNRLLLAASALVFPAIVAFGAEAPTPVAAPVAPFAPIVIEQADYVALLNYLNQQPYMFSNPIASYLQGAEAKAQAAAKAKPVPKPEAPKK